MLSPPIPFEPITGPITGSVVVLIIFYYLLFFTAAHVGAIIVDKVKGRYKEISFEEDNEISLYEVLIAGPMEEMGFRGFPILIAIEMGYFEGLMGFIIVILVNAFWAAHHFRSARAVVFTFILGLFLTKFWYSGIDGLWWMAILMHSFHNFLVWAMSRTDGNSDPRYSKG